MKDFVIPLLVAVIGLAATGLGALVGARAAKFGALKNAETVRRQVQDQGAVEHGHWLRQQRLNTYEGFLEAWDECLRLTQAPGNAHEPDYAVLDGLREAAGRMGERARRIALLGPEEVTRAADELAEAMQEDVEVATRFMEASEAAIAAVDGRPVPVEALDEATDEFERRTEQFGELIRTHRDQGRDLRELDGHPLLREAMNSMEQYRRASGDAQGALLQNAEQLSAITDEAVAMLDVLNRNKAAREHSRERFTSAVRKALGTSPMAQ